jgi:hypothetical protein
MSTTIYLRFADLKARGVVANWATLQGRIKKFGFPPGRLIGPNARAWTEAEVEAWIARQPTALKAVPRRRRAKDDEKGAAQ